jgi:putative CocE/NonD family hydrolase
MRPPKRTLAAAVAVTLVTGLLTLLPGAVSAETDQPYPPAPTDYVEMSDGTLIAINVRMPNDFVEGRRYPTIFEMSGYDGGSSGDPTLLGQICQEFGYEDCPLASGSRYLTEMFYDHYVTVHASVRGTGCSEGEFDLFSTRSALDGRELIEWIAAQRWSNGRVGIYGHSYGGITGFMVAATQPPHLTAVSVSGLLDDVYRAISYPGGVSNYGFPLLWTVAIRTAYDELGGSAQGIVVGQDAQCAQNSATQTRTVVDDPVVQGVASDTDNDWYRVRSLANYARDIAVPIHITGAYQDEQTGPRFPRLFELVQGIPKRMLLTNGDHGTDTDPPAIWQDRLAWMDHWIRRIDRGFGARGEYRSSVTTFFEMHRNGDGVLVPNGRKSSTTFPLEDTRWTNYFLREGGGLSRAAPAGPETPDRYLSGSPRQSWSYQAGPEAGPPFTTEEAPDELTFSSAPVGGNTAIVGPITSTLYVSSTAPDTELFVQLIDEGPDGSRTYLQRGMLKASHRAIDPAMSDYVTTGTGQRIMYRPFRPHTNPTFVTPGAVYEYVIEIWPVGHVFRPGHRIVLKVHTPPAVDSYYAYVPRRPVGINTVYHQADLPSRIMLPIVPLTGVSLGPELPCGAQEAVRCVPG